MKLLMKRIVLFALAALALVTAACKKTPVDNSSKPSVSWEANPSFTMMEIGTKMDAKVLFTVPEGVKSLQIKVTELPIDIIGVINPTITNTENKAKAASPALLDLVGDQKFVSSFPGFVSPSSVSGAKSVTLDFSKILNKLSDGQVLDNDARFTFEIALMDNAENQVKQTCRFRWTAAPEITFEPNRGSDVTMIYLTNSGNYLVENDKVNIRADGKVESIVISFEQAGSGTPADTEILDYVKRFTKGEATFDVVKNKNVAEAIGLIDSSADYAGKTEAVLDLGKMLKTFVLIQNNSCVTRMRVTVTDVLGKSTMSYRDLASENLGK